MVVAGSCRSGALYYRPARVLAWAVLQPALPAFPGGPPGPAAVRRVGRQPASRSAATPSRA